jgi:hypothetical protein
MQSIRLDGSSPSGSSTTVQTPTSSDMDVYMQSLSIDPNRAPAPSAGPPGPHSASASTTARPFPVRTSSATNVNGLVYGTRPSTSSQPSVPQIPTRNLGI